MSVQKIGRASIVGAWVSHWRGAMLIVAGTFCRLATMALVGVILTGCYGRRPAPDEAVATDTLVADTLAADTTSFDLVEDAPLSKAVDELFDDFFFNFAGNHRTQLSRIVFPLPIYTAEGTTVQLERRQWQRSYFFMSEGYYVILLDDEAQDSLSKDTTVSHARVERLDLESQAVRQYAFERIAGRWQLTSITHSDIGKLPSASFLRFYRRFATDEAFQRESLGDFVLMTAPDSDDDFTEVTGSIAPEQWPAFRPEIIPSGVVYCVNYGQRCDSDHHKVMIVRGVANGLNTVLTFQRKEGTWKLVKFSEI